MVCLATVWHSCTSKTACKIGENCTQNQKKPCAEFANFYTEFHEPYKQVSNRETLFPLYEVYKKAFYPIKVSTCVEIL